MTAFLVIACVLVVLVLFWAPHVERIFKRFRLARKFPLVFFPPLIHWIKRKNYLDFFLALNKRLGDTWAIWIGPSVVVSLSSKKHIDAFFLKTSPKGPFYRPFNSTHPPPHFFGSEHDPERRILKLVKSVFAPKEDKAFLNVLKGNSARLMELLRDRDVQRSCDVFSYFMRLMADSIFELLTGFKEDTLENTDYTFLKNLERMTEIIFERIEHTWMTSEWVFYKTQLGKQFSREKEEAIAFASKILNKKKQLYKSNVENNYCEKTEGGKWYESLREFESTHDFDQRSIAYFMESFMAGVDTLGVAIPYALLMLAMFPQAQDKVYEEVKETFNKVEDIAAPDCLDQLVYLGMVFKEVLRHISGPILFRKTIKDVRLSGINYFVVTWPPLSADQLTIPEGSHVAINLFALHHDTRHWERPFDFYPEHFQSKKPRELHFLPFAAGHRGCKGARLAEVAMKYVVALIVSKYQLSTDFQFSLLNLVPNITMRPKEKIRIRFNPRGGD